MPFSFGKTIDTLIAFRMVKILVQDWKDMDAYKLGIIDENGEFLKKTRELKTIEEKKAFTKFHVIMFRLKKVLQKLPFGKTKLASLAVALALLKEETGTQDSKTVENVVWNYLKETETVETINNLCEQAEKDSPRLLNGSSILTDESISFDGVDLPSGTEVVIESFVGEIFGTRVYGARTNDGKRVFTNEKVH